MDIHSKIEKDIYVKIILIKERFTCKVNDYLKNDIFNTFHVFYPNESSKHMKQIKKLNKKIIFKLLQNTYFYLDNIDKIILIQKYIKLFIEKKESKLRGPGFLNNKLCKNEEDFLFMIDIKDSDKDYFYSYRDYDDSVWYFDIRSINKLLITKKTNPYTRKEFPNFVYEEVSKLISILKKKKKEVIIKEYEFKDLKEKVKRKLVDLSVNITQSGYTFNSEWLESLDKTKLIQLYKLLEDMWNYRTQMTHEQKREIIPPTGIVFNYPLGNMHKLKIEAILNILIDDINKFENSIEEGNKKLGYIYLIACLSDIHIECYENNPWVKWL